MKKLLVIISLLFLVTGGLFLHPQESKAATILEGVALKSPTNVYTDKSSGSEVLKTYAKGAVLKFRATPEGWYATSVYINGKRVDGFINKLDVQASDQTSIVDAYAVKDTTHVYASTSTGSNVLKSYRKGTTLKFRYHSGEWFATSVYINGKRVNGYINAYDVSDSFYEGTEVLKGIGLKDKTTVYSNLAGDSTALKSYDKGSILHFRKLTNEWYETSVTVRGVSRKGYIKTKDIELASLDNSQHRGISLPASLNVYTSASETSSTLKSYTRGSSLIYRSFSENWYTAVVYVGGKARTGYIAKSQVENAVEEQRIVKGIGLKNPTVVYSKASGDSSALKTYREGSILQYKTFTSEWYEASVYVNGKKRTGYIHTSHTEAVNAESKTISGVALKTPTNVYSLASKSANVLKSYSKPNQLTLKTFSPNWFAATVVVNGKSVTGYIHTDDISTDQVVTNVTSYSTDFKQVVDIQMTKAPQVSGLSGGWTNASRKQVEYFVNSSNFDKNSSSYYQFLVLSQPAGLNAKEVNEKILNNHGILTGTAQAFIDAGKAYNINEAYLISHALLETGNGSSDLAKGVPVDNKGNVVSEAEAAYTVYNMYGIGAVDDCPLACGAKRAFEEEWFTPESAIIGGASFVTTYLARGQDTLYKIRWNPISPGYPQYATDIGWATKQTVNIEKIYKMLDNFVLIFDVPKYANQPSSSGDPNAYLKEETTKYPAGIYGVTSANVNYRSGPATSNGSLGKIPNGTKIAITETNGTWYKTSYNGKTGWVHGDYVDLLNLLEVTVSSGLQVRPDANTSGTRLGLAPKGTLLPAKLDSKNKMIRSNEWYQITYNGKTAWVSGGKNGTEYIKVK